MNIYLAGDSIVQDYTDEEFIAGWGQYLPYYIASGNNVINYAKGGRSSRLFINEGRFDELDRHIGKGDYLLIEFAIMMMHPKAIRRCLTGLWSLESRTKMEDIRLFRARE